MSYILDALQRADAERERGQVPGLHSQATPALSGRPASAARRVPRAAGILAALLLVSAAAAYWWPPSRTETPPPAAVTPTTAATPATPPVTPAMPPAQTNTPPVATAAPAAEPGAPAPVATTTARPILAPNPAPPREPPASPAPTPAPSAGSEAVRRYAELSPAQRSQIPPLAVSGGSYSANPAHRLLIVNGAVLQEGQTVAPGLTLEHIGAHEAVLNHQGLRFRIGF